MPMTRPALNRTRPNDYTTSVRRAVAIQDAMPQYNPRNFAGFIITGLVAMLASPSGSWAANLGISGGLARTPSTNNAPTSGSNSAGVTGLWDPSDRWTFDGGWGMSLPRGGGDPANPLSAKEVQHAIHMLTLGATWVPGAGETTVTVDEDGQTDEDELPTHWSFGGGLSLSPKVIERTATTLAMQDTVAGKTSTYDAPMLLQAGSSSLGGNLWTSWETGGTSDFETEITLGAALSDVSSRQTVEEFIGRNGQLTTSAELKDLCGGTATLTKALAKSCKRLKPLLKAETATLLVVPISLTVAETLFRATDVSLGGTYYAYSQDPNSVGYFSLANQAKKAPNGETVAGSAASFGTGVAVAPFDWSTAASVSHKLGPVRMSANIGYSHYYGDIGHYTSAGLRANYKVAEHWRLLANVAGQSDVDTDGAATRSWSGGAAIKYTF